MILTPDSLITNQSQETPPADHISHKSPSISLSLKTFLWKLLGNSDPWSTSYLDSLVGSEHRIFLHHNQMSTDWLYLPGQADTGQDQEHKETEVKNWVIILTDEERKSLRY